MDQFPRTTHHLNLLWIINNSPTHYGLSSRRNKKGSFLSATQAIVKMSRWFNNMEVFVMARKARQNTWSGGDIKFAQIRLEEEQKPDFLAWATENEHAVFGLLTDLAADGWKGSFSEDAINVCYIASHTQQDEDDKNYHVCVTSRAETILEALMLNAYKIGVLYKRKLIPTEAPRQNWG